MKKYFLIIWTMVLLCGCKPKDKSILMDPPLADDSYYDSEDAARLAKARILEDSIAKVMQWKPLKDGLSISKFGDIGFKTSYIVSRKDVATYRTSLGCCKYGKSFKDVIDIATFRLIGGDWAWGGYFKDKNHIYHFFGNSGGGDFSIVEEADYPSFEILNGCYGRDKNHIYDMRFGLMENINPKEFKIVPKGNTCIAKYNDLYYWGNDILDEETMKEPEIQKALKQLDKYLAKTKNLSN